MVASWVLTFSDKPAAPFIVIGAYVIGSLIVFPRPLLTLAVVMAFGPWLGFAYALLGIILAAIFTFWIGQRLGQETVRKLAGSRLNRLSQQLRHKGLLSMVTLRLVPLAPFAVINIVAGAARIRSRDFILGTFLGIMPGTLMTAILGDRLLNAIREPAVINFVLLAGLVTIMILGIVWLRRGLATG